jgi:hypothetical protein
MDKVDKDRNGYIDRNEFRAGFHQSLPVLLELVEPPFTETFQDLMVVAGNPDSSSGIISKTEERAITLRQLRAVCAHIQRRCVAERWTNREGNLLKPEEVDLYTTTRYVIKPATLKRKCSYVELVASGPQKPKWFVSHWWGGSVMLFLRCLEQHAADHHLDHDDTAYWVCAYANNQHNTKNDVTADPSESSFVKAIKLAEHRVLTVLDEGGVSYTRIWCCLELFHGLDHTYEVYTAKQDCEAYDGSKIDEAESKAWKALESEQKKGSAPVRPSVGDVLKHLPIMKNSAVGLTSGLCEADKTYPSLQSLRQASFPLDLVQNAFKIRVQDALASQEDDKRRILNVIAGQPLERDPPFSTHEKYDETNARLHGAFAAAALRLLIERGRALKILLAKLRSSGLRTLSLSLRACPKCDDQLLQRLAENLPGSLHELRVELSDSAATTKGAHILLEASIALGAQLEVLEMDECGLTGAILESLSACRSLRRLTLDRQHQHKDGQLTGAIPESLGKCTALQVLSLRDNRLTGVIPDAMGACTALQQLWLGDNLLTGAIPESLGKCTALQVLSLNDNQLTGVIPDAMGACTALQQLWLGGNQLTGGIPSMLGACTALQGLRLENNHLTGEIPLSLGGCMALKWLRLDGNRLMGALPRPLLDLQEMRKLSVYYEPHSGA